MKRNTTQRRRPAAVLAAAVATTLLFASLAPPVHAGATLEQPETTVYRTAPYIDQPQDEVWDVLDYRDVTVQVKITEENISATNYAKIHLQTSNTKSGQDWQTMETLTFTEGTDSAPVLYHKLLNVDHATKALGRYVRWQVEFKDASTSQWIALAAVLTARPKTSASDLNSAPPFRADNLYPHEDISVGRTIIETTYPTDASGWRPRVKMFLPKNWENMTNIPTIMVIHGSGLWDSPPKQEAAANYARLMNPNSIAVIYPEHRQSLFQENAPPDLKACADFMKQGGHGISFGDMGIMATSLGNMAFTRWEILEEVPMPDPPIKGYSTINGFFVARDNFRALLLTPAAMMQLEGWPILMQTHIKDQEYKNLADYTRQYSQAIDEHRPEIDNSLLMYDGEVGDPHTFFWEDTPLALEAQRDHVAWWRRIFPPFSPYEPPEAHAVRP